MSRSADYTIQGFLYQFNKALLSILSSTDSSEITVEGIIEDIEISDRNEIIAIQCKYHETKNAYNLSDIYEPLLQMMQHYSKNSSLKLRYKLYAHFPNSSSITLSKTDLEKVLTTTNKNLKKYLPAIKAGVNLDLFLKVFDIEIGPAFDDLVTSVHKEFESLGLSKADIETLWYPNAINFVGNLSTRHDVKLRKIKKLDLLDQLKTIKATAISEWTLALKNREILLKSRKKQLSSNLGKNPRLRHIFINADSIDDFDDNIVLFIKYYIETYHFKQAHIHTPTFCINSSEEVLRNIKLRLMQKGIIFNDGIDGEEFNENRFFRDPLISKERKEFSIRLLGSQKHLKTFLSRKPDDLFVLGINKQFDVKQVDMAVENIESRSFNDIYFVMGLSNAIN